MKFSYFSIASHLLLVLVGTVITSVIASLLLIIEFVVCVQNQNVKLGSEGFGKYKMLGASKFLNLNSQSGDLFNAH
ncbi:hypothetical protein IJ00_07565 [Calothrix sp. 336/3]|nr:hypothetical protein IJ00_07565 [Calothrix sp. 336/3]